MDPVEPVGARLRAQPGVQVLRDPRAHCGHGAGHLAAEADGRDQETGGPHRGDGHLEDCHHRQLPENAGLGASSTSGGGDSSVVRAPDS